MIFPFIGEISLFAFEWAPDNWIRCDGTQLLIEEAAALFAVIGNQFGGDGKTTFAVPDCRNSTYPGMLYGMALGGVQPNDSNSRPTSVGQFAILPFTTPASWIACNGDRLPVADYQPLFQVIGKTFGGDGVTTFNLPNLAAAPPPKPLMGAIWSVATSGNPVQDYPFLCEMRLFPANQQPDGWMPCLGQLLWTEAYSNLFSLLGTTFGGDGQETFALPNLTQAPIPTGLHYLIAVAGEYPQRQASA